jgi:hypothetical protein
LNSTALYKPRWRWVEVRNSALSVHFFSGFIVSSSVINSSSNERSITVGGGAFVVKALIFSTLLMKKMAEYYRVMV